MCVRTDAEGLQTNNITTSSKLEDLISNYFFPLQTARVPLEIKNSKYKQKVSISIREHPPSPYGISYSESKDNMNYCTAEVR